MLEAIRDINREIAQCKHCRLHSTRIQGVCGEGIIPAKFMFIAQAPGRTEDYKGKILIGPSGKVFDTLLNTVNLNRKSIYITNLVKCFLPKCRKPRQDEIETCYTLYLQKEIELVKPEIIVTLGYHVTKFVFRIFNLTVPNKISLKTTFGKLYVSKNQKILPLRHPATVVHKSKTMNNLISEYKILKRLQVCCPLIDNCIHYLEFKKGYIPHTEVERYCFGDWRECTCYE